MIILKRCRSFICKVLDVTKESLCVGLARVGSDAQKIVCCTLEQMVNVDLGGPLHSLIIPATQLHPLEIEYLEQFKLI